MLIEINGKISKVFHGREIKIIGLKAVPSSAWEPLVAG